MKRWKIWVAASALSMVIAAGPSAASADEMMMAKPDYSKVDVMMKDGMDWVPLRQIAESLGYTVTWNDADRSIALSMPKTAMGMTDKNMTDKSMTDKSMTDKSMTDKSMTDKSMTDKSMTDNGMTDNGMTDKSMTDKGMEDKSMDGGMQDKSMMDKKDMMDTYVVMLRIGSMKVTAGGKESDLTFAPAIWNDKTYVTKTFVESMLVSSTMK